MSDEREESKQGTPLVGRYANYFTVGHNAFEFLLDFGQCYAGSEHLGVVHTRIITGPIYAKALLRTLAESLEQYEQVFGVIDA